MASNNSTAAVANDAPRARAGATPAGPAETLKIPTLGEGKNDAAGESKSSEGVAQGKAEKSEYVTKGDLEDFAMKILSGAEKRWRDSAARDARDSPVMRHEAFDAESLTADRIVDIGTTGDIKGIERPDLVVERSDAEEAAVAMEKGKARKQAMLRFMEEMVCVVVSESTNDNEQMVFPLSVNGRTIYITRGEPTWIKRYYVDNLCNAKPADYKIRVVKDADGDVLNRATRSSALAYPFTVVEDRNPRGRDWLRQRLREG